MDRVDHPTAGPGQTFVEEDVGSGTPATVVPAIWLTGVQEELLTVIERAGLVPDAGTNTQLADALTLRGRNALVNGDFAIWQRQPSKSTGTLDWSADGADYHGPDRWILSPGSGGAGQATFSFNTFAPGGDVGFPTVSGQVLGYLGWIQNVVPFSASYIAQRVEGVRAFAGEDVTVSFWARLNSGSIANAKVVLTQHFGTGGSPSADVALSSSFISFSGSWKRYTFSTTLGALTGKTLGTDGNDYLEVKLEGDDGGTWNLDVALFQLELGQNAGAYEFVPPADQLARCRRYYQKSYPLDTAPGTATLAGTASGHEEGTVAQSLKTRLSPEMRAAPTLVWYSPNDGAAGFIDWTSVGNGNTLVVGIGLPCSSSTGQPQVDAPQPNAPVHGHWTADAEL